MNIRRISIRSIAFYLIRRIVFILILTGMCGCLFAGIKYLNDRKAAQQPAVTEGILLLTPAEKNEIENAALAYLYSKQAEEYIASSPAFHMNANDATQTIFEYAVLRDVPEGQQTSGSVETAYLQMIRAYISDGMYVQDLEKINEIYKNHKLIRDFVVCAAAGGEFTITVTNSTLYPTLSEDVKTVVEAYMNELMKKEKGLKFELLKSGEFNFYNATAISLQKNAVSSLINYRKAYMNAMKQYTPAQLEYFQKLITYMTAARADEANAKVSDYELLSTAVSKTMAEVQQKEAAHEKAPLIISKQQFLIGCLVGLLSSVALCFIMLYLSLKNRSVLDYSDNIGLRNLGLITVDEKHPFRNLISKMELKEHLFTSDEESVNYAAVRIGAYCKNHDIKEIAVLSSRNSSVIEKAVEALKKALEKEGVKLHETENVGTDSEALKVLITAKNSILVEQLFGGNRQKASELLKFCRENDVEVLGGLGVTTISR